MFLELSCMLHVLYVVPQVETNLFPPSRENLKQLTPARVAENCIYFCLKISRRERESTAVHTCNIHPKSKDHDTLMK